jgi:NDP-sugar pyrophosphorylase family protein
MIEQFIDIDNFIYKQIFEGSNKPWEILSGLNEKILTILNEVETSDNHFTNQGIIASDKVLIGENTVIEPFVYIKGPAIIGKNVHIRSGAYLRENVVIGDNSVVGHASEVKNSIFLNNSKAPHFNYVGNTIIGNHVNLGAGVICANVKNLPFKGNITINVEGKSYGTNTKYFGTLIGDHSKIGCNSVINPGTIIGRNVVTYSLTNLRGYIKENALIKNTNTYRMEEVK